MKIQISGWPVFQRADLVQWNWVRLDGLSRDRNGTTTRRAEINFHDIFMLSTWIFLHEAFDLDDVCICLGCYLLHMLSIYLMMYG
jgi:hypothetical protein